MKILAMNTPTNATDIYTALFVCMKIQHSGRYVGTNTAPHPVLSSRHAPLCHVICAHMWWGLYVHISFVSNSVCSCVLLVACPVVMTTD